MLKRREVDKILLSPYARTFYDEWLLSPQDYRYNMVCADQILIGKLDVHRLTTAIHRYINDHLLMNCHVCLRGGQPYWTDNDTIIDLDYIEQALTEEDLVALVREPFDLHTEPLYRFKLIKLAENKHRFIVILHHLLMDGMSLNEGLFTALSHYYNDATYTLPISLATQRQQVDVFQAKYNEYVSTEEDSVFNFWEKKLVDLKPTDWRFLHRQIQNTEGVSGNPIAEVRFSVDNISASDLEMIRSQQKISPYFFSQCIFAIVIHRFTQQTHFALTYPVAIPGGKDFTLGGQVNLTFMPYQLSPQMSAAELIHALTCTLSEVRAKDYWHHPITPLMAHQDNKALFNALFVQALFRDQAFDFQGLTEAKPQIGLAIDGLPSGSLLFEQDPSHHGRFRAKYDRRRFDDGYVKAFIHCYQKLYREVVSDLLQEQYRPLQGYDLLTKQQKQDILALGQAKHTQQQQAGHHRTTLHQRFEQRVLEYPQRIALVSGDHAFSYQALNSHANQLAWHLTNTYAIQPDDRIMVCMDRSESLIIAILAILKAGAAYVPVLGDYPEQRMATLVEDCSPVCVLVSKAYEHLFKQGQVVIDDPATIAAVAAQPTHNLCTSTQGQHLAYIIYTSGTTGKPKGVMQPHENVVDLFLGTEPHYHFQAEDVWVLLHAYVFDFSVWEIFGAILYGGKLIVPSMTEVQDSHLIRELYIRHQVTVLNQTPTAFYQLMPLLINYLKTGASLSLRYIILGGESLNCRLLTPWFELPHANTDIINMYGITETTVHVTYKKIEPADCHHDGHASIGKPFAGRSVHLLDSQLQPVPLGALGELYCSGGVARGYLNRPTLSAERFIDSSCPELPERLYKTGDLGRLHADGSYSHFGRIDRQIKLRGYRIEIGEIENTIKQYSHIPWVMVMVKEMTQDTTGSDLQYLIAYFTANEVINPQDLSDFVHQHLPKHMVPHYFLQIESLPMTVNGKIDLAALPLPHQQSTQQAPPRNDAEQLVCDTFAQILGQEHIGIDDSFFDLGGNSIQAIRLVLLLKAHFEIEVADIFSQCTPRNIAKNPPTTDQSLQLQLEEVRAYYNHQKVKITNTASEKRSQVMTAPTIHGIKPIKCVLLTGATGFLGCNLLHQLLTSTSCQIFVLVRAENTIKVMQRVAQSFSCYFDQDLETAYPNRVIYLCADIEHPHLNLSSNDYKLLIERVDSIIHCAALVKHYGNERCFYRANVEATENLLKLCQLTRMKDFHYISTVSVAYYGQMALGREIHFSEDTVIDADQVYNNIYNKTKFLGEQKVKQWHQQGINGYIYRVGNMAMMARESKTQRNIADNAFAQWLSLIIKIGCVPAELSRVTISPTDLTAQAIVSLFSRDIEESFVFHICDTCEIDLLSYFKCHKIDVIESTMNIFMDKLIDYSQHHGNDRCLQMFLLHQGWAGQQNLYDKNDIHIDQQKTAAILDELGFYWPTLPEDVLHQYVQQLQQLYKKSEGTYDQ